MRRFFSRSLIVLLAVFLLPASAHAQAAITGVIRDASGGVLPGVTVEAASPVLRSLPASGVVQLRFGEHGVRLFFMPHEFGPGRVELRAREQSSCALQLAEYFQCGFRRARRECRVEHEREPPVMSGHHPREVEIVRHWHGAPVGAL